MKNDKNLLFNMLCDHTAVDKINQKVFDLIYSLYSTIHNFGITIIVTVPRNKPIIDTLSKIWRIAEWQEREVYDFFGILYKNHPDLRRPFLEDDWVGFPLRKDYKDNFILEI
jgi:NADH:ubiquinone oxidoreductase subunit C